MKAHGSWVWGRERETPQSRFDNPNRERDRQHIPRSLWPCPAQLVPEVFSALRVAIDDHRTEKGRFVVTGSSSPALMRSVSESLAGRVLNYAEVARALSVSQPTARDYFEIAHGTFVWRRIPPFTRNVMKRVVKHPRGYLRDSGLLHALLRIPDSDALLSHPQMGASWEGMVIEEIIRQMNALGVGHDYSYYRTGGGAEVDLVLQGDFGLVAIEIKYSSVVKAKDLRALKDFVGEHKARLGLVINNDRTARRYDNNLLGLPFNWL